MANVWMMIKMLQSELDSLKGDANKFDKGFDQAGVRVRNKLIEIKTGINNIREDIQKTRYYREAYAVHFGIGTKKVIKRLEHKEKKYGKVSHVAKLQVSQGRKA